VYRKQRKAFQTQLGGFNAHESPVEEHRLDSGQMQAPTSNFREVNRCDGTWRVCFETMYIGRHASEIEEAKAHHDKVRRITKVKLL
jgi:hypothetical protein